MNGVASVVAQAPHVERRGQAESRAPVAGLPAASRMNTHRGLRGVHPSPPLTRLQGNA